MKKRIFSMVLALIMATTLILSAVPTLAAPTITVSVKAPADWYDVNLYVWEDIPMADWPGSSMTKNGDWWTLIIPAGYTNVIANNGNEQTIDLRMDGYSDVWIVIPEVDYSTPVFEAMVYTDAACTQPYVDPDSDNSDYLAGLQSLAIVGIGVPGVSEWNPADPAGDMTLLYTGVYVKELYFNAGDTMEFKFAGNDAWDNAYTFGSSYGTYLYPDYWAELSSDPDSYDITFSTYYECKVRFTLNLTAVGNGGSPILWIEDITNEDSEPEETITIYAKVPSDWQNPCIWCWDDASLNPSDIGSWPGNYIMTMGADGWYYVEIPVGFNNLVINANGGANQTPDILGLSGQDVWINAYTDPFNPVFDYEEITDIPCLHPTHDTYGYCNGCGEFLDHQYNSYYSCECGAYATDLKTVYFKKTDIFSNAYVYWQYDDSYDWTMMPGVRMEYEGDDIYSAQIPANVVYITFNDNWDTELKTELSGMTSTRNVFDPDTNSWITYAQAVPPEDMPPVIEPTEPEQKPTQPDRPVNDDDDDDDDDDRNHSVSVSTSGDPSWIFITLAVVIVVGMVVMLIFTLKKKN